MDNAPNRTSDPFSKLGAYAVKHPKGVVFFLVLLSVLLIAGKFLLSALHPKKNHLQPTPVQTAVATTKDVPVYLSALGTVSPVVTVSVKTQINGTMQTVYVSDGQMVKAGQVLAHIDSRVYEAQLLQYEGAKLRDQALLNNAMIDLTRYQHLYRTRAVSKQTLDTQATLVQQYTGAVKIDQGQIDAAKTNLAYCTITSPVSGRIGIVAIDPGNVVQTSDATPIAVITTLDPIDIIFPLPEKNVTQVFTALNTQKSLPVIAYDQNLEKVIATGVLKSIDNQVNLSTGTVNFKSEFANPNTLLFPNQFLNVKLWVDTLRHAIVVPTSAIQEGSQGAYVYRYNQNHTVSYVPIKTGVTVAEDTVITAGIAPNQIVITQGADKLTNGAMVSVGRQ